MPLDVFNLPGVTVTAPMSSGSSDSVTSEMQNKANQTSPPTAILRFPPEAIEFGILFRFVNYSYKNQQTNTRFITSMSGASIALPLPRELQMRLGLVYAAVDSGVLGYAAKSGYSLMSAEIDGAKNMLSGGATPSLISNAASMTQNIGTYVMRKMAAESLSGVENVISQLAGNVVNPYNVATFQHTQSRQYAFTFSLVPMSQNDSDTIKKISDAFMYHSLPYDSVSGPKNPAVPPELFLNMPDEVEISFYGSEYLFPFARAVIHNVSVDYAPGGQASFFGASGAPTSVVLHLGIQEIQQLSRSAFATQAGGYKDPIPAANSDDTVFQSSNIGPGLGVS